MVYGILGKTWIYYTIINWGNLVFSKKVGFSFLFSKELSTAPILDQIILDDSII
jgi:hypothetical protein